MLYGYFPRIGFHKTIFKTDYNPIRLVFNFFFVLRDKFKPRLKILISFKTIKMFTLLRTSFKTFVCKVNALMSKN